MKEGTETALYNQGYMDGFDDAEKDKDTPALTVVAKPKKGLGIQMKVYSTL